MCAASSGPRISHRPRYARWVAPMAIALGVGFAAAAAVPVVALAETAASTGATGNEAEATPTADGTTPSRPARDSEEAPPGVERRGQDGSASSNPAANAGLVIAVCLIVIGVCEVGSAFAMRKDLAALSNVLRG